MKDKFTLGKCKTRAAYSAKLKNPAKLNLKKIKEKFKVVLETPILVVIKEEGIEVIVHGYGELLFKKCEDIQLMEDISERIYGVGLK